MRRRRGGDVEAGSCSDREQVRAWRCLPLRMQTHLNKSCRLAAGQRGGIAREKPARTSQVEPTIPIQAVGDQREVTRSHDSFFRSSFTGHCGGPIDQEGVTW